MIAATMNQSGEHLKTFLIVCSVLLALGWFAYIPMNTYRSKYTWLRIFVWFFIVGLLFGQGASNTVMLTCTIIGIVAHFSFDVIYRGARK
jgi:hypothetical protein